MCPYWYVQTKVSHDWSWLSYAVTFVLFAKPSTVFANISSSAMSSSAMSTRTQASRATRYEELFNMNANNGRFATWLLRVKSPQITPIKFKANQKDVEGFIFQCVLTSNDPKQYMFGRVPFEFKNRNAALDAQKKFVENSVWKVTNPSFDGRAQAQYISSPIKVVLLLKEPSKLQLLGDSDFCDSTERWWPSETVHVPLSLTGTINALKKVRLPHALGSEKGKGKALDLH